MFLKPAFMCKDPMRKGDHILVLCEMLRPDMTPIKESTRTLADAIFNQALDEDPWFGIEQEYTLFKDGRPMGWPASTARPFNSGPDPMMQFGYPGPQGAYYCGVGYDVSFGRLICEKHLDVCLEAGLNIGGINGEVMPGQWEYQIGPATGIEAGDHMHMSRFLLNRVCEEEGVVCSFDPKPIPSDDWNGAGCHTNFSTKKMRNDGGYEVACLSVVRCLSARLRRRDSNAIAREASCIRICMLYSYPRDHGACLNPNETQTLACYNRSSRRRARSWARTTRSTSACMARATSAVSPATARPTRSTTSSGVLLTGMRVFVWNIM